MGLTVELLCKNFPYLYHMADEYSWPSIKRHGLLSTSALLDLFEITGHKRELIEAYHRPESVRIHHPVHGAAVIRDQKPMSDKGLIRCLPSSMSPSEWYKTLNEKVFFWLSHDRLMRLVRAKAYRAKKHCVLTIDTARLLSRHVDRVVLSPINSGCTKPYPHPRDRNTFLPIHLYPYDYWRSKRRKNDSIVELAVQYSVPGISEMVKNIEYIDGAP